jgi:hypothetical protein
MKSVQNQIKMFRNPNFHSGFSRCAYDKIQQITTEILYNVINVHDGTASQAFWLVATLGGPLSSEPDLINELTVIKWNINQKQLLQV